jgi:predicted adenine nucleotide alpha hydrolase (AANH) superfamily ATPase
MEKLLLHHCCGPCSPKVAEQLSKRFAVESYWFNPNIHPAEELALRKASLESFCRSLDLRLHEGPAFSQEQWLAQAPKEAPDRCRFCYRVRLRQAAAEAQRRGIAFISTTLLSSPYQKHELIREEGLAAAAEKGLTFVAEDFRPWYYEGKNAARLQGLYMQKYCGCLYSREEREREKAAKKAAGRKPTAKD